MRSARPDRLRGVFRTTRAFRETRAIAEIPLLPTGYERRLPPAVQVLVGARRRALFRRARGRILDLGGAESHAALWPESADVTLLESVSDPRLLALARDGARFDAVVSVFQLVAAADLDATIRRVSSVLTDDGDLLFLDVARRTGLAGRSQSVVAGALGVATGWRLDRDIPRSLRHHGLSVVDLTRHRFPTTQPWLRAGVEGRAHRARPRLVPEERPS